MATTVDNVISKTRMVEIEPKNGTEPNSKEEDMGNETEPMRSVNDAEKEKLAAQQEKDAEETKNPKNKKLIEEKELKCEEKEEQEVEVPVEVEPKTGVSFPIKLEDGKQLKAIGLRKKSMFGMGIKVYAFGIYADDEKLKTLVREKMGKAPTKPTKEMYQMVIDSDVGMVVRMVIVFSSLTMSMVQKNFDEGLGAAIKKLTGAKNDELTKRIMGEASDDIKLASGSVIEISKLPGYTLQTKVMDEIVSKVDSELLCRAYIYLYLGDDPFDKEAKEKFGTSMLSLF